MSDGDQPPGGPTVTLGTLALIHLQPGDRALLRANGRISMAVAARLREMWNEFAPGVPVFILDDDIDLNVLRADQVEGPR